MARTRSLSLESWWGMDANGAGRPAGLAGDAMHEDRGCGWDGKIVRIENRDLHSMMQRKRLDHKSGKAVSLRCRMAGPLPGKTGGSPNLSEIDPGKLRSNIHAASLIESDGRARNGWPADRSVPLALAGGTFAAARRSRFHAFVADSSLSAVTGSGPPVC